MSDVPPKYKVVSYPIRVPDGIYCWEWTHGHAICPFFDNEGGVSKCALNFYPLITIEDEGVLKPYKCRELKQTNEKEVDT